MSKYPPVIGATAGSTAGIRRHRMNQIYGTVKPKPVTKLSYQPEGPNMLKRMIRGLVTWSMSDRHDEGIQIQDREEVRISASGIRFEVYRANGGTVIETRRNDRRTGDSIYELHVVSSDQDVGAEIGKIITLESLKS